MHVYADVMACMMEQGSEYFPFALTLDGKRHANPPLGRRLRADDLVHGEIVSVWGTQIAEEDQPVVLGGISQHWKPLVDRHREVYDAGLRMLKEGTRCAEFLDFGKKVAEKNGVTTKIFLSGRGAGDDGPVIDSSTSAEKLKGISIEKNTLWLWRPTVSDGNNRFTWGGTVLVTDQGAERLAKRPHGLMTA